MKKRILTFSLFAVGLVLVLFLLLPFLETTAPNTATDATQAKKASPQIFTSNPLTDLVNRIARFFGKKNKTSAPTDADNRRLTAQQADHLFGVSQEENAVYASQHEATTQTGSYTTPEQYEQALFQTADGAWVLVHQKSPEGAAHGMHEINTRDNAYDTYIKQERMARFTPTAVAPKQESLPDSRLARLFRPIKKFFGWDDSTAARTGTIGVNGSKEGFVLASSERLGKNAKRKGSKFSRGLEVDAQPISLDGLPVVEAQEQKEKGYSGRDTDGTITMLNWLMPAQSIRNVAELEATTKFGNPTDPDEKKAKEEYAEKVKRDMLNKILYQPIKDAAGGKKPEELIEQTWSCEVKSLLQRDTCSFSSENSDTSIPAWLKNQQPTIEEGSFSEEDMKEAKRNSARYFKENTAGIKTGGIDMPDNIKMTVVLGQVIEKDLLTKSVPEEEEGEDFPKNREDLTSEQKKEIDKKATILMQNYFLKKCQNTECFWVANKYQTTDPNLKHGIETANLQFHGDPSHLFEKAYSDLRDKYWSSEEMKEDMKKIVKENHPQEKDHIEDAIVDLQNGEKFPAYIPYTKEELQQIQQQNIDLISGAIRTNEHLENATILYVPSAEHALEVSHALAELGTGAGAIIYGNQNDSVSEINQNEEETTPAVRGSEVIKDLVTQINNTHTQLQAHRQDAVSKNIQKNVGRVATDLQQNMNNPGKFAKENAQTLERHIAGKATSLTE